MADTTRLHLAYRSQLARITAATTGAVLGTDPSDPEAWVAAAVPTVLAGQRTAVRATDAYMALEAGLATGTSTRAWGIDPGRVVGARARNGRALEDVYGANLRSGYGTLRFRVSREVGTDITLAQRRAAWMHTSADPRIVGYRRTLGGGPNCPLCVAASTRTYKSESLQPIHDHCGCSVAPIYGTADAPVVDGPFLEDLYSSEPGFVDQRRIAPGEVPEGVDPAAVRAVEVVDTDLGPTLRAA